jgi:hypothetical protein
MGLGCHPVMIWRSGPPPAHHRPNSVPDIVKDSDLYLQVTNRFGDSNHLGSMLGEG